MHRDKDKCMSSLYTVCKLVVVIYVQDNSITSWIKEEYAFKGQYSSLGYIVGVYSGFPISSFMYRILISIVIKIDFLFYNQITDSVIQFSFN